jgi:hypothetical protein
VSDELHRVQTRFYTQIEQAAANPLDLLEAQHRVLSVRTNGVCSLAEEAKKKMERPIGLLRKLIADAKLQSIAIDKLQSQLFPIIAKAPPENLSQLMQQKYTGAVHLLQTFEQCVVSTLVHDFYVPADCRECSSTCSQQLLCVATFADLELLLHSVDRWGSTLYLHWCNAKRVIPIDDTYFDVKDAVYDQCLFNHSSEDSSVRPPFQKLWQNIEQLVLAWKSGGRKWPTKDMLSLWKSFSM